MTQWHQHGRWHAGWIRGAQYQPPIVSLFHLTLTLTEAIDITLQVSGDERFEFYVNNVCMARGPERGDGSMWHYHTVPLKLPAGTHHLAALVWSLGEQAAYAQMSEGHGLLVAAPVAWAQRINTGRAPWQWAPLHSYTFTPPAQAWGTGCNVVFDARQHPWGWQHGHGVEWQSPTQIYHGEDTLIDYELGSHRHLQPAPLPAMRHDYRTLGTVRHIDHCPAEMSHVIAVDLSQHQHAHVGDWQALCWGNAPLTIPAHTTVRVIIDCDDYVCAYPHLLLSGGQDGRIRWHWEEALSSNPQDFVRHKGNRDDIVGKFFNGVGDTFIADGSTNASHQTLWWQAGRYCELCVTTADTALTIERIGLYETGYPFAFTGNFDCDDTRLTAVIPMMHRALQMCAHETYMDCPYYEQLMYVGDTRLEALTTYVLTPDDRLPRKAIQLFHQSRLPNNLTQSRYPSRIQQLIPPFSLWWVGMVYDLAMWRDQATEVARLLPGVRNVLDAFLAEKRPDGLLNPPAGWNFVDWVVGWEGGMPAGADRLPCATINWHVVYTLELAVTLEQMMGETQRAAYWHSAALALRDALDTHLWDAHGGYYRELVGQELISEHAQCLAMLSGVAHPAHCDAMAHTLRTNAHLARTTIYFSHYLFETYRTMGAIDLLLERMQLWFDLPTQGFKTTVEQPEPSRSDCHAWGAHPLYHYHATLVGIRPATPGFRHVRITPQLGPLQRASCSTPHPHGTIEATFWRDHGVMRGRVQLPAGVSGEIVLDTGIIIIPAGGVASL